MDYQLAQRLLDVHNASSAISALGWDARDNKHLCASPSAPQDVRPLRCYGICDPATGLERQIAIYSIYPSSEVVQTDTFLTKQECEALIQIADAQGWTASKTSVGSAYSDPTSYASLLSASRTSYTSRIEDADDPLVHRIIGRAAAVFEVPLSHIEAVSALRYTPGQQFKLHHDGDFRTHSILIYLNDVHQGGETVLPELNLCFKPRQGSGICWRNVSLEDGTADMRTLHGGLPVQEGGVKYCIPMFVNRKEVRIMD